MRGPHVAERCLSGYLERYRALRTGSVAVLFNRSSRRQALTEFGRGMASPLSETVEWQTAAPSGAAAGTMQRIIAR
jgi:hypothetical protein